MSRKFRKNFRCLPLVSAGLIAVLLSSTVAAQDSNRTYTNNSVSNPGTKKQIRFEVISIRPSTDRGLEGAPFVTQDGFTETANLYILIQMAYNPMNGWFWNASHVLHLPAWATRELYRIDARVAQEDLPAWQSQNGEVTDITRVALRAALKERCNLTVNVIPTEVPYLDLVVDKHGARLSESKPINIKQFKGVSVLGKGFFYDVDGKRHYIGVTMKEFAQYLMRISSGNLIQDKTGLDGRYDFVLPFYSDVDTSDNGTESPVDHMPLKDIGLTLRRGTGPSYLLDVVSINKPDAN
jgi:uncharacterized protein (TIGR03435 family)